MYSLIIWYREKPYEEIKRYAALITGIEGCLNLVKEYNKKVVLVEVIIQNERAID